MVRSLVDDKRLRVVRAEEAMTTVERLRDETTPSKRFAEDREGYKRSLVRTDDLRALLEAAEEAEKALGASEHECPGPDNPNDCGDCLGVSVRRTALARLRSLGFGGKV